MLKTYLPPSLPLLRWEMIEEMTKSINAGETLIVDRYAFREAGQNLSCFLVELELVISGGN
jgi:hypothetical protein